MERITRVRCIVPFTRLNIRRQGDCFSCCPGWTNLGKIGRLSQRNSIMEIWNLKKIQYLRQAILDDQLEKECDFKYCPIAAKNEYLDLKTMKNDDPNLRRIIDQIRAGRTALDTPPHTLEIANSGKCNLRCIMCGSNHKIQKKEERFDEKLFTQIIPELAPHISRLLLAADGEVLYNPYSRKFLQMLEPDRYPFLRINLLTNGTLLTPKLWETIRHNRYDTISVSIDAASKETYEKIRQNGNWDILRRNLDLISELRRQKVFSHFSINFVVMKSNYREMKDFVELGLTLGCDQIAFSKILGRVDPQENINFINNKRVFTEIATILSDSIFDRPDVDTTLVDEYKEYLGQGVSFRDDLITKVREVLS